MTLVLGSLSVILFLLPVFTTQWVYHRGGIEAGELWRILSCHWVHASWGHLLWNLGAFLVLGSLVERMDRLRFHLCVAGSAVLIPAALWVGMPDLAVYGGVSGIASALFVLLAVLLLKREIADRNLPWVAGISTALLAFLAKTGYESLMGKGIFVDLPSEGLVPVPLAHAAGALVGLSIGLFARNRGPRGKGDFARNREEKWNFC